jgi:flagellar protein FlaJ
MKSSKYSKYSLKLFESLIARFNKKSLEEKNILFVKANIQMSYEEYYSTALMSTIISAIAVIIFSSFFYMLIPSLFVMIMLPLSVISLVAGSYYYYPFYQINIRGRNIDLFLPYAINFISSMAVAGISPSEIFETLSNVSVYGEIQNEAKRITNEIKVMGMDNITALKHAIEISPSIKFKAFLQGIIGTIQSGSELHIYLANVSSKFMEEDLTDRKKDLDLLVVIAEVLVLAVIAFPILLVIILTVMGFFGGSMEVSLELLLVFSFLILPSIYMMFYFLIKSTSIEQIRKVKHKKTQTIKETIIEYKTPLYIFLISIISVLGLFLIAVILGKVGFIGLDIYLYWDLVFIISIILIAPIGFYSYIKMKEQKEMQQRLPEFLTEVGDSLSTGLSIFESIKKAQKGHYGKLDPQINKMRNQLSWNVSIKNVLFDFASRMKSAIAERIVNSIDKGLYMGGSTDKIFKAASKEVDQVNQIENQRKSIMSIYSLVILVCFFVFLAIILILFGTIFAPFLELQSEQLFRTGSAIKLSKVNPFMLEYTLFSFTFVQSLGAGILAGFMSDGKLSSGVRYCVVLGLITIIVFKTLL